jgi:hypothetical protein
MKRLLTLGTHLYNDYPMAPLQMERKMSYFMLSHYFQLYLTHLISFSLQVA